MLGYTFWTLLTLGAAGLGTLILLLVWDRRVRAEEAQAERIASAWEAEAAGLEAAEQRALEALALSERRSRALAEAGALALWRASLDGCWTAADGWQAVTGQPASAVIGQVDAWLDAVLPKDRPSLATAWARSIETGMPLDAEFRIRMASGEARWCRVRGVQVPGASGQPDEWAGVVEDIHARRELEEARLLLSQEVNHRAKNLLAVVQAILRLTPPNDPAAYASAVSARVAALGRAHDLLAASDWHSAGLREIAQRELAAHLPPSEPRAFLAGDPVSLAAPAVQPMAMVLHELAVNAAKYGALSRPEGRLALSWWVEQDALHLQWRESGGPPMEVPPARRGFGSRVIETSVTRQLHGRIERRWEPEGLLCEIWIPLSQMVAEGGADRQTKAAPATRTAA